MTPRPNCAAGPLTRRSVSTAHARAVRDGLQRRRDGRGRRCPGRAASCASRAQDGAVLVSSASVMRTVPSYRLVIGPSLIFIVPLNVSPSPPSSAAPGQAGRDALDVEQDREGLRRRARAR